MLQGKSVFRRIRNARNSLDNAERSFSSHQEIRGELDLMLAEAELQNLRQKRGGRIGWTRHTFAACAAVLLLAAGGLGWWWASAYGEHTLQAASPAPGPAAVSEKKESVQTAETMLRLKRPYPGCRLPLRRKLPGPLLMLLFRMRPCQYRFPQGSCAS